MKYDDIKNINRNEFTALTFDSRTALPGSLFFCKGEGFKEKYLRDAVDKGIKAYVSEREYDVDCPCIKVPDIRIAMDEMANEFYGYPWKEFKLIGVTGTVGKTTTVFFINAMLRAAGRKVSYISSVDTDDGVENFESHLTTPEALDLLRHFDNARSTGADAFVMEVSSQALKYHRTRSVVFDIGVFLNFEPDHISNVEHCDAEDFLGVSLSL
ncbi:MAG: Mur ligase family protein [Eubacteriales bacterium]|nr:Mur ligase family protein [Eubacteriales bacterium]